MDPWEVLGIEPCQDGTRINKAYAARLKHTNPEDDPEGFQKLRQAYEMVLHFLEFADEAEVRAEPIVRPMHEGASRSSPRPATAKLTGINGHGAFAHPEDPVATLIARAKDLCTNKAFEKGGNEEQWRAILEDDALWNLENRTVLARADRLYSESLGGVRETIRRAVGRFEVVLSRQDPREIDKAREELTRMLDELEKETW